MILKNVGNREKEDTKQKAILCHSVIHCYDADRLFDVDGGTEAKQIAEQKQIIQLYGLN